MELGREAGERCNCRKGDAELAWGPWGLRGARTELLGVREWGRGQPDLLPSLQQFQCPGSAGSWRLSLGLMFQSHGWIFPELLVPFPPQSHRIAGAPGASGGHLLPQGHLAQGVSGSHFNLLVLQPSGTHSLCSHRGSH